MAARKRSEREFLLADELKMDALRAAARKRREEAELRAQNDEPATEEELSNALVIAFEVVAREAAKGNLSAEMTVAKAAVRAHLQKELCLEGLTVRDDEQYSRLHIQWST